jgi:hypothetical protein
MTNSITLYINTAAEGRKKLREFKKLTGAVSVELRAEGVTSEGYIYNQLITEDFKTIDFHQYNGVKRPLKFKDRIFVKFYGDDNN